MLDSLAYLAPAVALLAMVAACVFILAAVAAPSLARRVGFTVAVVAVIPLVVPVAVLLAAGYILSDVGRVVSYVWAPAPRLGGSTGVPLRHPTWVGVRSLILGGPTVRPPPAELSSFRRGQGGR